MKQNDTALDVTQMGFERLTLVMQNREAGKAFAPINPEAVIIGVKAAATPTAPGSVLERAIAAVKAQFAKKDTVEEIVDQAIDWAKRDAMYDLIWSFYYQLGAVLDVPAVDVDAKRAAVDALCAEFGPKMAIFAGSLIAEKAASRTTALKAGARHNKQDAADVAQAHAQVTEAITALQAAQEATARLAGEKTNDDSGAGGSGDGSKATPATAANSEEILNMTKDELATLVKETMGPMVADAVKALAPAAEVKPADTGAITKDDVAAAIKAVFDEQIKPQIDAATKAANDAQTAAAKAQSDLAVAVNGARDRQAPGGHTTVVDAEKANGAKPEPEQLREAVKAGTVKDIVGAVKILSGTQSKPAA